MRVVTSKVYYRSDFNNNRQVIYYIVTILGNIY